MAKYCYKCEKDVELVKDSATNAQLCGICGTILIHSASKLPTDTIISGFQIIEEIGRGGMGIVYRAKQLNLERNVALKVLADDLAKDEEFVENFFKEARAAASLNHPNIVQVFDAGSTPEGIYYFAMELISGETLETKIERDGALDPKEAMRIAVKIAEALDYAWESQKLTHGDIKPDNIILDSSGGAKLADLGLAKFMHDDSSEANVMATPLYAPPEIIKGETEKIGSQSDMYSFGATLFQMLAGVPPFPDDLPDVVLKKHLTDSPPLLSNYNPRLVPTIVQLVNQLLEKDPAERPFNWSDICKALKKIREPEIEGKIFHTHHTPDHEKTPVHTEEPVERKKNFGPLIGLLVAVVIGLLVAISAVVVGDQKIEEDDIDNDMPPIASTGKRNEAKEALEVIKSQVPLLPPRQIVEQLERLLEKYGNATPEEAKVLMAKYKKQTVELSSKIDKQKQEREKFANKVAKLIKDIKATAISSEKIPIKTIQNLSTRIDNVLHQASKKKYLKISPTDRSFLNNSFMALSTRLIEYKQDQEKIAQRKDAEARQRKIEAEERRKAEEEKKREEGLAFNRTIDNFYLALANYQKEKDLDDFAEKLDEWRNSSSSIPGAFAMRVKFLKRRAIPNAGNFIKYIIKEKDALKGQALPLSVCPTKYRKYKVKEVDKTGIKLLLSDGKVSMGYTLKWTKMPSKVIAVIIKERLLVPEEGKKKLNSKDTETVLAFTLLRSSKYFADIIDLMKIKNKDKNMWNLLANDFIIAEDEKELIYYYRKFTEAFDEKDFLLASKLLIPLKSKSKLTAFGKRYANELRKMENTLLSINPSVPAYQLLNLCEIETMGSQARTLFNVCMVAAARYANILDEKALAKFKGYKDESLQKLVNASGVQTLQANRIPFYYWSLEKTGSCWAFYDIVKESGKLDSRPDILASMQLAAALDNGDWIMAKRIFESDKALDIKGLAGMTKTFNWASSFIFARGVLSIQFGNADKKQEALSAMIEIARKTRHPAMKPITTALAMEYCMLCKQNNRAMELGANYNYNLGQLAKIEAKVALLYILGLMEKENSEPEGIKKAISLYNKHFRQIPGMKNGDIQFCYQALNFLNNNFDPKQIPELRKAQCNFPDVAARILLSGMARYYCKQQKRLSPESEKEILGLISRQIKSIFVANESWRRFNLFKIALQGNPSEMSKQTARALSDIRICSTAAYPGLMMFKGGTDYVNKTFSLADTKENLQRFLDASPVTAPVDLDMLKIISSPSPSAIVSKYYVKNLPAKGFNCALLGILCHYKDPNLRSSIVRVLNENYNLLSWEERYLIKQLQTW